MRKRRCSWTISITFAALGALFAPAAARAGLKTCLTGADPSVAGDFDRIRAVRTQAAAACVCARFDGTAGRTRQDFLRCVKGVLRAAATAGDLRKQCVSTVNKYYTKSACGVVASPPAQPCITTTSRGTVTCAIVPPTSCVSRPGRFTKTACPAFAICIDATDSNLDGLIATGDTGSCNPTGCCAFDSPSGGLCMDTSFASFVGPVTCQQLNGTWVGGERCDCDASRAPCVGVCGGGAPPTAVSTPQVPTPTPQLSPPPTVPPTHTPRPATFTATRTWTLTATPTPVPTSPGAACTPQMCGTFATCSTALTCSTAASACVMTTEGTGVCMSDFPCSGQSCTSSAACGAGFVCTVNTCCGVQVCSPSWSFCPVGLTHLGAPARSVRRASQMSTAFGNDESP